MTQVSIEILRGACASVTYFILILFYFFIKTTGLIRPLKQLKMQLHYKRVQT